jgi:hypothetical protein
MRGFYNVFTISSKVGYGSSYESTEIRCQDHVHSSYELIHRTCMPRYNSFPTRLHEKFLEISKCVHLALSRVGTKQKLTNHKSISMPPGMCNILKGHLKALPIDISTCKLFIDYVPIVTKEKDIAYTQDNTFSMISNIVSHAKDDGAWRREKIKGYTRENIAYRHLKKMALCLVLVLDMHIPKRVK